MTPQETAAVLAKCSGFDQRTVGSADVMAWHEVIGYLDLEDCLKAVTVHYSEQSNRAMPADIRRIAIPIRDRRKDGMAREERLAIEAGVTDRSEAVTALIREVAASLPQPDVHKRAVARARAERGGPAPKLARKPKKTKGDKPTYPPPQTDAAAAMATRYLIDGYTPADVSERLGVNRRWCEKTAAKFAGDRA